MIKNFNFLNYFLRKKQSKQKENNETIKMNNCQKRVVH